MELLHFRWVIEIDIRIPEVQLEAKMKLRIFRATRQFFERIILKRI